MKNGNKMVVTFSLNFQSICTITKLLDFYWPANILVGLNFLAQENPLMSPNGVCAIPAGHDTTGKGSWIYSLGLPRATKINYAKSISEEGSELISMKHCCFVIEDLCHKSGKVSIKSPLLNFIPKIECFYRTK